MLCIGCLKEPTPLPSDPVQWPRGFCPACDARLADTQHARIAASHAAVRAAVRADVARPAGRDLWARTREAMSQHELGIILHEAALPGARKYRLRSCAPDLFDDP